MKISASIYSNKNRSLPELIQELDECGVDYFHVDCKDNPAVFEDIAAIRQQSTTPIDLHIITPDPAPYFELLRKHPVEYVTFQHEDLQQSLEIPSDIDCKWGVAITSGTPVETFRQYQEQCRYILFMTTTPGESGGRFDKNTFRRIRKFRRLFPGKRVHVDGGVNAEVSFILRNMAVNASVSGSYLVNNGSIGASLAHLFSPEVESHYFVSDFMMSPEELPVLTEQNLSVSAVLQCIESYRMGFCMVVDETGVLKGLISNADVRRGLIRNIADLNAMTAQNIINPNPKFIYQDRNVSQLIKLVKSFEYPILYLPVLDKSHKLVGAVSFNNLIKGEL